MGANRRSREEETRHLEAQRGSALAGVMIVSLLVGAAGIGAWTLARYQLIAAERRGIHARARRLALSTVPAVAGWFEAVERGSLVPPPGLAEVDREGREIDLDGDGRGTAWRDAAAPWDCRYKEGATGDSLFRPPGAASAGGPEDLFAGCARGPELRLGGGPGKGRALLDSLARILEPDEDYRIEEITFFRPPERAGPRALATVEVVAEARVPGAAPRRVRARGEVIAPDWGRRDRPILCDGDARFLGEAGWLWGEALISGELRVSLSTAGQWPGGIPWAGPDRPLRLDNDGDGTADDRDGDGSADLEAWRSGVGPVPDPWWRARVGGAWPEGLAAPTACEQPFPFGPWLDPPEPAPKQEERSGLFVACPSGESLTTLPLSWLTLSEEGRRGAARYVEDPGRLGFFRADGIGGLRPAAALIPRAGGLVVLELASARTTPLELELRGEAGVLAVVGGELRLRGARQEAATRASPAWPRDTGGEERTGAPGDPVLELSPDLGSCSAWEVEAWEEGTAHPPGEGYGCHEALVHFRGTIAAQGRVWLDGPLLIDGQLRARGLELNGESGKVEIRAVVRVGERGGMPGVPRVVVRDLRTVYH